jgi:integrase/recombinase XerD
MSKGTNSPDSYVMKFLHSCEAGGLAESTLDFYTAVLTGFVQFVPEWPPDVDHVEAYLRHKRKTVSEVSVHTDWKGLSAFLNWCESRGHIPAGCNPLRLVRKPKKPQTLPKPANKITIRRLFSVIGNAAGRGDSLAIRDMAMFRLCYSTGCRCSELANLAIEDLDLEYNAITIRQGKGGRDRVVYYVNASIPALRAWLEIRPESRWLFCSRVRTEIRPLTRGGVYKALQKWCALAEVKLTVHQLRHSYATHGLRNGLDLGYISRQMGHSSITTTAIYLALEDPGRREAHLVCGPGIDI